MKSCIKQLAICTNFLFFHFRFPEFRIVFTSTFNVCAISYSNLNIYSLETNKVLCGVGPLGSTSSGNLEAGRVKFRMIAKPDGTEFDL